MLESGLYVALSGQLALQRRMDTIAHNVANSTSAGFRAEAVTFDSLVSGASGTPVSFAATGETFLSRRPGEMMPTGNPLDVAIRGDGWLAIETPAGRAYTRDGRMQMLASGEVQTLTGYPVLDESGSALQLSPSLPAPQIAQDGTMTQNGRRVGRIGLFSIEPGVRLSRFDTSAVVPEGGAEPVVDFGTTGMAQGFVERANVNPVMEMTQLISVSRAFDALATALNERDAAMRSAMQTLGS